MKIHVPGVLVLAILSAPVAVAFSSNSPPAAAPSPKTIIIPTQTPGSGDPIRADWDAKPAAKEWTRMTIKALDDLGAKLYVQPRLSDAAKFCPNFAGQDRAARQRFYVMLISAMARHESAFKPETKYKENFKDSKGNWVISRGLLQLSHESANGYGCAIEKAEDLHDPDTNIRCSVRILSRWISKDGAIGTSSKGGGRYWSVLREARPTQRNDIARKTSALLACRKS